MKEDVVILALVFLMVAGFSVGLYYTPKSFDTVNSESLPESAPAEFNSTELVSDNLPESIEFWTQAYCPGAGAAFDYKIPTGFKLEACEYGLIGSHGGCSYCTMAKVKLVKGINAITIEQGACGSAAESAHDSAPLAGLCEKGNPGAVNCYYKAEGGCRWCWSCGAGSGMATCCEKDN